MAEKQPLGLYIHIPFCQKRCGYCDFNTYAGCASYLPAYINALQREIEHYSHFHSEKFFIKTIYFGGGTPSILPPDSINNLVSIIFNSFDVDKDVEFSLEANPNDLRNDYFNAIRKIGVNRISFGMQSAICSELAILDRDHSISDVEQCVTDAKAAQIENINLDLIFGIPGQTLKTLAQSVRCAVDREPDHLSIYGLYVHEGTLLAEKIDRGMLVPVENDLEAEMYAWLINILPQFGFEQYEISNWAKGTQAICRHNMLYWQYKDWLGIGAGAHSHITNQRWHNILGISAYIRRIVESTTEHLYHPAIAERTSLSCDDVIKETMMMGLRLTKKGVNIADFHKHFRMDLRDIYRKEIDALMKKNLIEIARCDGEVVLRLTKQGRLLGNQVFMAFI